MDTFCVSQHSDYALMVYLFSGAYSLTRGAVASPWVLKIISFRSFNVQFISLNIKARDNLYFWVPEFSFRGSKNKS